MEANTSYDNANVKALKVEIKKWESGFSREHGRKPTKCDIVSAPTNIKESYRSYWKLMNKSSRCESSTSSVEYVWSAKLNKSNKSKCKSDPIPNRPMPVLQDYVNKLRNKAILSKTPYVKLPVAPSIKTTSLNEAHSEAKEVEMTFEAETPADLLDTKWKVPASSLHFRDKTLQGNRIRVANAFLAQKNGIAGISSAKVDVDWLNRCSVDSSCGDLDMETKGLLDKQSRNMEVGLSSNFYKSGKENVLNSQAARDPTRTTETKSKILLSENDRTNESNVCKEIDIPVDKKTQFRLTENESNDREVGKKSKDDCYEFSEDVKMSNTSPLELSSGNKKRNTDCIETKSKRQCIRPDSLDTESKCTVSRTKSVAKPKENFVKLNLKKKVFVRGKRNFSYKKYKRNKWKHYQKNKQKLNEDDLEMDVVPLQRKERNKIWEEGDNHGSTLDEIVDSELQTLKEASCLSSDDSKSIVSKCFDDEIVPVCPKPIEPLYDVDENGKIAATPKYVFDSLKKMGFDSFRPGQERAIMRILSGLSALMVLPTGMGKSLCYQLPAFIYSQKYQCITLVISPLVSLMEDQVANVPSCLRAACWHSNLTEDQKKDTLKKLTSSEIDVLLVSPETLVSGSEYLFGKLPPIAFVCIDEAHCLSEWSHNFRPSYLQLIKMLRDKMGISCILALTATASKATANSIASHLGVTNDEGAVIEVTGIPNNLYLSVSRDEFRDEALVCLLRGERFATCSSIIIYCTRREETERVASTIRICMQNEDAQFCSNQRKKRWLVEAYHSGLTPAKRKSVQKRFMNGCLRIVVATVAFGMGLNKVDVQGIIHYNMPKTFEHYVQEIGRAGRDGKAAHCHLFLNVDGKDLPELRRHIYSNSVDRRVIRKLLLEVFKPCRCVELDVNCLGHEIAIPICDIVNELDLKEENVATLLCYLEMLPEKLIEILQPIYAKCLIRCYKGQSQFQELAKTCPPVAIAVGLARKNGERCESKARLKFDVVRVASHMGWYSGVVKRHLKNLEWSFVAGKWKKTGVMVEFSELSFHLRVKGTLKDDQKDLILDQLYDKVTSAERRELKRLEEVHETFKKASNAKVLTCCDDVDIEKSDSLKKDLMEYYACPVLEYEDVNPGESLSLNALADVSSARKDIRAMLEIHHDTNFTGRAIARIFHGIGSPRFPVEVWGRVHRFWRSHIQIDFNLLISIANEEIMKMR